jgi:hypothetical protein
MQLNSLKCSEGFTALGMTEDGMSAWDRVLPSFLLGTVIHVRTVQSTYSR